MKYLFIDESGDHNLLPNKIDPHFPMFVLTGIIFDSKELTRPNITKQKALGQLTDTKTRKDFYDELNNLLENSNFDISIYSIDKKEFNKTFNSISVDLYFLSFANIFKKFELLLKSREHGKIFTESRNRSLDKQFILTWNNTKMTKRYKSLEPQVLPKSWKYAGLELADLISYRMSRHIVKKPPKPIGNEIELKILMKKNIQIEKFALKKRKRIRTSP